MLLLAPLLLSVLPAQEARPPRPIDRCVLVQPIEVRDDSRRERAKMRIVEPLIDRVYGAAGLDFCFLEPVRYDSTDALEGRIDVDEVVHAAGEAGALRGEGEVIHLFFVRAINGKPAPNGLGQQPGSIVFAAQAEGAPEAQDAFVVAHEAAHCLGLPHAVDDPEVEDEVPNLMGDGPFEERVGERGLVPGQFERIRSSPLARPRIEMLGVEAGRRVLLDESWEPFLSELRPREVATLTSRAAGSGSLEARREETRRRFREGVLAFDERERAALEGLVRALDEHLREDFPLLSRQPWRFVKIDDRLCGGFPHTRGTCLVFGRSVVLAITRAIEERGAAGVLRAFGPLLAHEKLHVLQRMHPRRFESLYTGLLPFERARVRPDPWVLERRLSNPDALDTGWVVSLGEGEGRRTWWLRTILREGREVPRMGADFLGLGFQVERRGEVWGVVRDERGIPRSRPIEDLPGYRERLPVSSGLDHPGEIAAYALARILERHHLAEDRRRPLPPELIPFREWFRANLR